MTNRTPRGMLIRARFKKASAKARIGPVDLLLAGGSIRRPIVNIPRYHPKPWDALFTARVSKARGINYHRPPIVRAAYRKTAERHMRDRS